MKIEAYLINVKYDNKIDYEIDNDIFLKVNEIKVFNKEMREKQIKLEIDEGIQLRTHLRGKLIGLYQLGIRVKDGMKYSAKVRCGNRYIKNLRYNEKYNMFFDSNIYYKDRKGKYTLNKDYCNDFNSAGVYSIDILKDNILRKSINVTVFPSGLSYEDYLVMIEDLKDIRENLAINENGKVGTFKKWESKIEYISGKIEEIETLIKCIELNPKNRLKNEKKMISKNEIKKVNGQAIREILSNPQRNKYKMELAITSTDIYEHKAIYSMIEKLEDKLLSYIKKYNEYIESKIKEVELIKKKYKEKVGKEIEIEIEEMQKKSEVIKNALIQIEAKKNTIITYPKLYFVKLPIQINSQEFRFAKANLEVNEKRMMFKLMCEPRYIKERNIYSLGLSNNLDCLEEFEYREINQTNYNKEKLLSKKFEFEFETRNLNEIIFLYEELNKIRENPIIDGIIGTEMNNKYIFGGDDKGRYWQFKVKILKVNSINENKVPIYSEEKKLEFIEEHIGEFISKDFNKNISFRNKFEEFGMLQSILDKDNYNQKAMNNDELKHMINKVKKLKCLEMFKGCKNNKTVTLKPSQIFNNDIRYRKLYKVLKNLDTQMMISFDKSNEIILMSATQNMYELWILFKIVDVLVNELDWSLEEGALVKEEVDKIIKARSQGIKNIKIRLNFIKDNDILMKMNIFYEEKIFIDDKRFKKPDYKLEIVIKEKKYVVYLDAKYRNYDEQGMKCFIENDIKDVAIKKYIIPYLDSENEPIISMIVHSSLNQKYVDFTPTKQKASKYIDNDMSVSKKPFCFGGFFVVPSNVVNLKLFFKMIFEYHLQIYDVCWNCGETIEIDKKVKQTESNYKKYHYKCKKCGEFWVKTHCIESKCNHDLIKHLVNYHLNSQNNMWNVECPECSTHL